MPGVVKGRAASKAKAAQTTAGTRAAAAKPPLPASKKRKRQPVAPPAREDEADSEEHDEAERAESDEHVRADQEDGSADDARAVKKEDQRVEVDDGLGSSRAQQIELDAVGDDEQQDGDDLSLSSSDAEQQDAQDPDAPFDELALPLRIYIGTYTGSLYALESLHTLHHLLTAPPLPPTTHHTTPTPTTAATPTSPAMRPSPASSFYTLFNTDAHRASIHAVACSPDGSHVVSSGVDEVVQLYRLQGERRHVGSLHRHYASVNQLLFPSSHTFLSASDDGTVAVFSSTHQWEMVKRLSSTGSGSTARVLSMSLHPSHRALLTSSSDGIVRMWDMVRGVEATRRRTKVELTSVTAGGSGQVREEVRVAWEEEGRGYVMVRGRSMTVYDEQGAVRRVVHADTRILSAHFIAPSLLIAGCEDYSLRCWDGRTGEPLWTQRHHAARIRCLDYLRLPEQQLLIASASTDGQLCVWRGVDGGVRGGVERVGGAKSEARVTALCCGVKWDARRPAREAGAAVEAVQMDAGGEVAADEEKAVAAAAHGDGSDAVRGTSGRENRSHKQRLKSVRQMSQQQTLASADSAVGSKKEQTVAAKPSEQKQKQTQRIRNGKTGQVTGEQRLSEADFRTNEAMASSAAVTADKRKSGITIVNNKRRAS